MTREEAVADFVVWAKKEAKKVRHNYGILDRMPLTMVD